MMEDLETRLRNLISSVAEIAADSFSASDDLVIECGIDSMKRIEIVIAIEKEYGIEIGDDIVPTLRSFSDFRDVIEKSKRVVT